jgi:hypothetical protein
MEISGVNQHDFEDPKTNLFYSMFNQSPKVPDIIPLVTKRPGFAIMADRSPQDDGLPLDANSANHMWFGRPTGQNVLFSSTEVKWVEQTAVGIDEDEIYARGSFVHERVTKDTVPVDKTDSILMPVAE